MPLLDEHARAAALDALPDAIVLVDGQARIVPGNRRAEELFAAEPGDEGPRAQTVETNRRTVSAFHATSSPAHAGDAARKIVLVDPNDGTDLVFEVLEAPLPAPGHDRAIDVLVLRDVTDLEATERELETQLDRSIVAERHARSERERLRTFIDHAAVPIVVSDRHGGIELMNREAERLLTPRPGTTRAAPHLHDIDANHAALTGCVADLLQHARTRGEARLSLVDPDEARELTALAVSTKIFDERGDTVAVVSVLHDLTHEIANRELARTTGELTMRNTQLEEEHTALARASRLKSEFLATMSHELRTPIHAVLGYNSLLRNGLFGELSDRQGDALDRMRGAAEHLLTLVNDVLDLSRVEAGKLSLNPTDIDWASFVEGLSESIRPLAASKSLAYTAEVDAGVPSIWTDEMRLRQVLLNLLTNAVKFTDAGSVELRVGQAPGSERVRIDVTDTGIGIEEAHLATIFDEFTQVDQTSTREHGGAGLGLPISRRLIRVMGGSLTVRSTPGEGSTFRVELPPSPPTGRERPASSPADHVGASA
ncbi:MAG: ATP-binding protein [Gemmatimonadales bacterium]